MLPCSILQNQGKTSVLLVLPPMAPLYLSDPVFSVSNPKWIKSIFSAFSKYMNFLYLCSTALDSIVLLNRGCVWVHRWSLSYIHGLSFRSSSRRVCGRAYIKTTPAGTYEPSIETLPSQSHSLCPKLLDPFAYRH